MNNNKGETMANKIFKTLMLGALAGGILLTAGMALYSQSLRLNSMLVMRLP